MTEFQKKLLNLLTDKYENNVKAKIFCNEKEALFSDYFSKKAYIYRPGIEKDVFDLQTLGFVTVLLNADKELKTVSLNCPPSEKIYSILERRSKEEIDKQCLSLIESELCKASIDSCEVTKSFLLCMKDLILNGKKHKLWFEDEIDLKKTSEMVSEIEQHSNEELLRNFSKRVFGDSKTLERNSSAVLTVFNKFGNLEFEDFDSLLASYGILRNPSFVMLKGPVTLFVNKQKIDLQGYGFTFSLPDAAIELTTIDHVFGKNIITVENLTTFNTVYAEDSIMIYLGGFSSSSKIRFLKLLEKSAEKCNWYHFSDIDVGGFRIFNDLRNKTGIDFKPLLMGVPELTEYKSQCQKLSEFDVQNLTRMKDMPEYACFRTAIEYMLEHDCKLEQESVKFSVKDPSFTAFSDFCRQTHFFEVLSKATWRSSCVHINCFALINISYCIDNPDIFKKEFKNLNSTPENIENYVIDKFQKFFDYDFYNYVTAEKYYEPVLEDYGGDRRDDFIYFFNNMGLKVTDISVNTKNSGYIPD